MTVGPLPPGATIGMLGGGQLGRMAAVAAARLGYRVHVLTPERDSPASQVSAAATVAALDDADALARFADSVPVATLEFENVPVAALEALERRGVVLRPGPGALAVCQDRLREKAFLESVGVPVPPWRPVRDRAGLDAAAREVGLPAVLKTTRLGYDGRGQAVLRAPADLDAAWERLSPRPLILEAFVPFAAEVSALVARGADGATVTWDAAENRHAGGILDATLFPARVPEAVAAAARAHAARVAEALGHVGVLAVEFFLLPGGALLGNEIAPRPHNSGHPTMDACGFGQFEAQVRAAAGLPLGDTARHSDALMRNLIGAEGMARWPALLTTPGVVPHFYGKAEARPGRKMGHATRLLARGALAGSSEADVAVLLAGP